VASLLLLLCHWMQRTSSGPKHSQTDRHTHKRRTQESCAHFREHTRTHIQTHTHSHTRMNKQADERTDRRTIWHSARVQTNKHTNEHTCTAAAAPMPFESLSHSGCKRHSIRSLACCCSLSGTFFSSLLLPHTQSLSLSSIARFSTHKRSQIRLGCPFACSFARSFSLSGCILAMPISQLYIYQNIKCNYSPCLLLISSYSEP
jgi:hypothetical protein